jgi:protein subunit release factor A
MNELINSNLSSDDTFSDGQRLNELINSNSSFNDTSYDTQRYERLLSCFEDYMVDDNDVKKFVPDLRQILQENKNYALKMIAKIESIENLLFPRNPNEGRI